MSSQPHDAESVSAAQPGELSDGPVDAADLSPDPDRGSEAGETTAVEVAPAAAGTSADADATGVDAPVAGIVVRKPHAAEPEPEVVPRWRPSRAHVPVLVRGVAVLVVLGAIIAGFALQQDDAAIYPASLGSGAFAVASQLPTTTPAPRTPAGFQQKASPSPVPTRNKPKVTAPPRKVTEQVGGHTAPPTATPTGSASPGPVTLADYLKLIPSFGPPPTPVPVAISHAAGEAADFDHVPTSAKVAFITIDDGWYAESLTQQLIEQSGVPVVGFLTIDAIESSSESFFADLQSHGMVIEDHTISHPDLTTLDLAGQEAEICPAADQLASIYGRRPIYMRAPYLTDNENTLIAANSCGIKAVISAEDGVADGVISYGFSDLKIHAGDIIVMHFEPDFAENFVAALQAIKAAGLTPAPLEDWFTVN